MTPIDDDLGLLEGASNLPGTQLLLAGLLALTIQRDFGEHDSSPGKRPEVVLADVGMTIGQIARLTGRNYETVKSTLRRARSRSGATAVRKGTPNG
jgi:hypothetical protein